MSNLIIYPAAIQQLVETLDGTAPPFDTCTVKALLVRASTTIADAADRTAATLAAFSTLDEYSGGGYARVTVGSVVATNTASEIKLDMADPAFTSLGSSGTDPTRILVFVEKNGAASDSDRVPLFSDVVSGTPDGGAYTYTVPTAGLVIFEVPS